jgi:hypothetical protein
MYRVALMARRVLDRSNRVLTRGLGLAGRCKEVPMTTIADSARTRPPYEAYAAIMGVFVGGLGVAGAAARALDRDPACQTTLDLVVLSAASFKAARTLASDEVTSFLREPFVQGGAYHGDEEPLESGDFRQAIGELVTCSRCGGTWAAAGLAVTQILSPRFGQLLTWSLAAAGVNDWLQAGFAALTQKANELEERASR